MSLSQKWQPAFSFDDDDDMDQIYEEIFERCKNGTASAADWRDLPADYKAQLERLRTPESGSDSYSDEEDTDATEYEFNYTEKDWEVQRPCTPGPGFDEEEEDDPHTVAIFDSDDLQPITAPTKPTASMTFNAMPNPLSNYAVPVLPCSDQHKPHLDTGCYCADCAVTTMCERARHPARNPDQQPTRDFQDYKQENGDEFGHGRSALRGEIVVEKGLDGNEIGFVRVVQKDDITSSTPSATHDYSHARRTSTPILRPLKPSIYVNRHGSSFMKTGNVWRDIWAQCPLCEMPLAYVPDLERARHLTVCHGEIREQNVAWAIKQKQKSKAQAQGIEEKIELDLVVQCIICGLNIVNLTSEDVSAHLEDCACEDDAPVTCPVCEFDLSLCEAVDEGIAHLKACQDAMGLRALEEHEAKLAAASAAAAAIDVEVVGAKTPYLTSTIGQTAELKSDGTDQRTLKQLLDGAQPAVTMKLGRVRQVTPAVKKLVFTVAPEPEPELEIEEHPHHQEDDGGCMSPVPIRTGTRFCRKEDIKFGFEPELEPELHVPEVDDKAPSGHTSGEEEDDEQDDELNTSDSDQPSSASSVDGSEVDIPKDVKLAISATEETGISTGVHFKMPMQWPSPLSIATLSVCAPTTLPSKLTTGFLSGCWMGLGSPLSVLKRRVWDMLD